MVIIGVDTGGTFTDFIYKKDGKWGVLKILSTPENPAKALLEGIKQISEKEEKNIIHGTTVATNALLERKGAKVAFITNKGFEDIIYIGRQNRKRLYDLHYKREKPLVEEENRYGLDCRINSKGEILKELEKQEIENLVKTLKEKEIKSVAVSFLFSFLNNTHEKEVEERLKEEGFFVSPSYRIIPEFREYERGSTVVVNAYVMPKMNSYISYIEENLSDKDILRIMQSNGGSISTKTAKEEPVRTILSGPAGGVVGAFEIGKKAGFTKLITFDMGGTSTDVSLINESIPFSTDTEISSIPVKVPIIDIHTVGAGGGSIAYVDKGGALNVGPESAGADPGPVCYGKGENITVTDANLFLGRLIPDFFLGGNMKLDKERTNLYMKKLAKQINLSPIELAEGILTIANTKMEKAIRVISVEKGYNPEEFTLFSFGGAGGMHAVFLAKALNIPKVLVPRNPGILSAMGMLMADIIKDYSSTVMLSEKEAKYEAIKELFSILEKKAREDLKKEGAEDILFERYLDMRYKGQSFEVKVPFSQNFIKEFHNKYEKIYGFKNLDRETQVVNIRLRAIGKTEKPEIEKIEKGSEKIDNKAILGKTKTVFNGEEIETYIIDRKHLKANNKIDFPSIVVEYSSTIVIPPECFAYVDEFGNLIINVVKY